MSQDHVVAVSRDVMQTHARTFSWAAAFLPADCRDDAAVLYALCREIDDLGDELHDRRGLLHLKAQLDGRRDPGTLVEGWLDVAERRGIDSRPLLHLIDGVLSDLGEVRMADDGELLRYCYRVAGTVGLLMCGILGVTDPEALPHAVDLGLGMQLTNICRDVLEDAERGRIYLPATRLRAVGYEPAWLFDAAATTQERRAAVGRVVLDLLDLADRYYASAERGMRAIPWRTRLAIRVAAGTYRAIGDELRHKRGDALDGRVFVGTARRLSELARVLVLPLPRRAGHDVGLHEALAGMPGTSLRLRCA